MLRRQPTQPTTEASATDALVKKRSRRSQLPPCKSLLRPSCARSSASDAEGGRAVAGPPSASASDAGGESSGGGSGGSWWGVRRPPSASASDAGGRGGCRAPLPCAAVPHPNRRRLVTIGSVGVGSASSPLDRSSVRSHRNKSSLSRSLKCSYRRGFFRPRSSSSHSGEDDRTEIAGEKTGLLPGGWASGTDSAAAGEDDRAEIAGEKTGLLPGEGVAATDIATSAGRGKRYA